MAVTVSRPVVHDSGLGTLAQLLGVYVGYQNMKTRRASEIGKISGYQAERDYLGQASPYTKTREPDKGGGLSGILTQQQTAEEARARAEGPGLTLFPTGRPEALRPSPSREKVAGSPTPVRPPSEDGNGKLIQTAVDPRISAITDLSQEQVNAAQSRIEKQRGMFKRWAGTNKRRLSTQDWGDKQALNEVNAILPAGDKAHGRRVMSAATNEQLPRDTVQKSVSRGMDKMTPAGRDTIKKTVGYSHPVIDNIANNGAKQGVRDLSKSWQRGEMWAHGNESKRIDMLMQHAVIQDTLNDDLPTSYNPYRDLLNKALRDRESGLGRRSAARGRYIKPERYALPVTLPDGRRTTLYGEGHRSRTAFKDLLSGVKDKKLRNHIIKNYSYNNMTGTTRLGAERTTITDEVNLKTSKDKFDKALASDSTTLPANAYEIYSLSGGKEIGYYETEGSNRYTRGSVAEFLSSAARDYDFNKGTVGVDDNNIAIAKDLLGIDLQDYFEKGGTASEAELAKYKANPSKYGSSTGNSLSAEEKRIEEAYK